MLLARSGSVDRNPGPGGGAGGGAGRRSSAVGVAAAKLEAASFTHTYSSVIGVDSEVMKLLQLATSTYLSKFYRVVTRTHQHA